ncbi:MAG: ABC transporter substrate-binding protein, partial [Aestuariivirga sp.]
GVPWNESGYSNKEFDDLLSKAEGTVDVKARSEILGKLETIMQEDGPIVQPLWRSVYAAYDKRVQGFQVHPTLYIFGEDLAIQPA